jgi:hypothetical protein
MDRIQPLALAGRSTLKAMVAAGAMVALIGTA